MNDQGILPPTQMLEEKRHHGLGAHALLHHEGSELRGVCVQQILNLVVDMGVDDLLIVGYVVHDALVDVARRPGWQPVGLDGSDLP
jgi:hypothetical protein